MKIYEEITDLAEFESWSGADETAEKICDADMGTEFITLLEEIYPDGITKTGLNDLLRFDSEFCLNLVGLSDEEEDEEEEED